MSTVLSHITREARLDFRKKLRRAKDRLEEFKPITLKKVGLLAYLYPEDLDEIYESLGGKIKAASCPILGFGANRVEEVTEMLQGFPLDILYERSYVISRVLSEDFPLQVAGLYTYMGIYDVMISSLLSHIFLLKAKECGYKPTKPSKLLQFLLDFEANHAWNTYTIKELQALTGIKSVIKLRKFIYKVCNGEGDGYTFYLHNLRTFSELCDSYFLHKEDCSSHFERKELTEIKDLLEEDLKKYL